MAMEPVGHAGIAAAVTGFISTIMAVPISILFGRFIADRRCHYLLAFRYVALSVGLLIYLKIDEKRVNITSENRI
jgi:DHA1 family bicyclomycin/chloramphenicol resistance-like MFS transporter